MIDLHTHTLFSDGELIPSELVRRAEVMGYEAIGITDHVDGSNIDFVLPRIAKISALLSSFWKINVIPGVEITHAPLQQIGDLVKFARKNGAKIVVVHGETPSEPVIPGTNRAAIESRADILAHPGYITREDAELAARNNVCLEITARPAHKSANRHVAKMAVEAGAKLVLNTDAHDVGDLITGAKAKKLLKSLKLKDKSIEAIFRNSRELAQISGRA